MKKTTENTIFVELLFNLNFEVIFFIFNAVLNNNKKKCFLFQSIEKNRMTNIEKLTMAKFTKW